MSVRRILWFGIKKKKYELSFSKMNLENFQFDVMEDLWWKKTRWHESTIKALVLNKGSKGETITDDEIRKCQWSSLEEGVNFSFHNCLLATPPMVITDIFSGFLGGIKSKLFLKSLRFPSAPSVKSCLGHPDFVLCDENQEIIILGEQKVSLKKAPHKYTFEQYVKYQNLAACLRAMNPKAKVLCLVLHPSLDFKKDVKDNASWDFEMSENHQMNNVRILGNCCLHKGHDKEVTDLKECHDVLLSNFSKKTLQPFLEFNSIDTNRIREMNFPYVDTYFTSWNKFVKKAIDVLGKQGEILEHLIPSYQSLESLFVRDSFGNTNNGARFLAVEDENQDEE